MTFLSKQKKNSCELGKRVKSNPLKMTARVSSCSNDKRRKLKLHDGIYFTMFYYTLK